MGGGATRMAPRLQKTMCIGGGRNRTTIKLDQDATQHNNYYNDNHKGGGQPQQGGPPQGGKIGKEGQGKEERLVSAEEVCRAAIQVDVGNAGFLLMAEAMVATATASLSTIALGVLLSLGLGMTMIIPGLLLL
jgi:hypothetical protein